MLDWKRGQISEEKTEKSSNEIREGMNEILNRNWIPTNDNPKQVYKDCQLYNIEN